MITFITDEGVVEVPFSPKAEALYLLLASERRLFTPAEMYEEFWGFVPSASNAMQSRIRDIRRTLAEHGIYGKIHCQRGVGYMLV